MAALSGIRNVRQTTTIFRIAKAFIRLPHWPRPVTQPTIGELLRDINYFEQPKTYIDIGHEHIKSNAHVLPDKKAIEPKVLVNASNDTVEVDDLLSSLAHDTDIPPLDLEDCNLDLDKIVDLAQYYGIYRDLFNSYKPNRDEIYLTQDQAKRMARILPNYWITDQPYRRVKRHPPEPEPMRFFKPYVNISARFVIPHDNDNLDGHVVYHGNHIPACDTLQKPSITLDGRLLSSSDEFLKEKNFNNWVSGSIENVNFDSNFKGYLTVALVNLDTFIPDKGLLHWLITDIKPGQESSKPKQICDYLPAHGIRGFGYSRYVFLVFRHDEKLNLDDQITKDFSPSSRQFDATKFLECHKQSNIIPIGLSWFQTSWDQSSNSIFREYLKTKVPEYEHVQTKEEKREEVGYPGLLPFNIYLDHKRNKKDINEQVLLERLKSVDPCDYKDQYVPPKVPETVFVEDPRKRTTPSWLNNVMWKKNNKLGYWRGLRPASATLPLANNADLDKPCRPLESADKRPLDEPNHYVGMPRVKLIRDLAYSKPANEHEAIFIQDDHDVHIHEVKKIISEMKSEAKIKKESKKQA